MAWQVLVRALLSFLLLCTAAGCRSEEKKSEPPSPSKPPVVRPCTSVPQLVEGIPGRAGAFCVDAQFDVRRYGAGAASPLDAVCVELFNEQCELYRAFGLEGVKTLRFIEESGAPHYVHVTFTRFRDSEGAFAFFSARVLGDSDASELGQSPLEVGGRAALGQGHATLWRGKQVAEFTYISDDETPAEIEQRSAGVLTPLIRAVSGELRGPDQPPRSVVVLEALSPLPLGVAYRYDGALGVAGSGSFALGHFSEPSHRLVAAVRRDEAGAKDFLRLLKRELRGRELKHRPIVELQVASERHAPETWFASRLGSAVLLVGPTGRPEPRPKTRDEREEEQRSWREFAIPRLLELRRRAQEMMRLEPEAGRR